MAESKHTPGPWKIVKRYAAFDIMGPDGIRVLTTSWHGSIRATYPLKDESYANATLGAAAPFMLEALKHAAANMPHPDQMIDDAIALAEGRSNG